MAVWPSMGNVIFTVNRSTAFSFGVKLCAGLFSSFSATDGNSSFSDIGRRVIKKESITLFRRLTTEVKLDSRESQRPNTTTENVRKLFFDRENFLFVQFFLLRSSRRSVSISRSTSSKSKRKKFAKFAKLFPFSGIQSSTFNVGDKVLCHNHLGEPKEKIFRRTESKV